MHPAAHAFLAARHGVATPAQLVNACQVTEDVVKGWVRRGKLRRAAHNVVAAPGSPDSPEQQAMIALLRSGPGARMIGPRAFGMLGIRGFDRGGDFAILVSHERNLPRKVDFPVFRDPHPDDGAAKVGGELLVPRPGRLAIEMARFLAGDVELRTAIDAARWKGLPNTDGLLRALAPLPMRYGPAARVRRLVRAGHLDLESEPERIVVDILGDEFGMVETQVWVTSRRRVDVLLRKYGLALEYQGADHRTAGGRRRDRVRDDELADIGITVVPIFHEDLANAEALRARLRRVIARRRAG